MSWVSTECNVVDVVGHGITPFGNLFPFLAVHLYLSFHSARPFTCAHRLLSFPFIPLLFSNFRFPPSFPPLYCTYIHKYLTYRYLTYTQFPLVVLLSRSIQPRFFLRFLDSPSVLVPFVLLFRNLVALLLCFYPYYPIFPIHTYVYEYVLLLPSFPSASYQFLPSSSAPSLTVSSTLSLSLSLFSFFLFRSLSLSFLPSVSIE